MATVKLEGGASAATDSDDDANSVEAEPLFIENCGDDQDEVFRSEEIDAAVADLALDQHAAAPQLKDWEDVPLDFVEVSLGQASHDVWMQAQHEIQCARNSFVKFFGSAQPTVEQFVAFLLGPESELFRVIKDEVGWSYEQWGRFLKTYCLQSLYNVSAANLYDPDGYVQTDGLTPHDEYVRMWRQLGTALLPDDEKAAPASLETLWMKTEAATNSMFRRLVVEPWMDKDDAKRLESVEVVFDDNKMWHDARAATAFLNMVQHVRDNRRGPVHHDAVASATGLIAGFRFERKKDTSISTMREITRRQFVPAQGGTELRDLNWLFGKGDRAYTMKEALYGFFLPSGARMRGTKKRSAEWPQSYGIPLKDGDERTDIPKAGGKSMMVKSVLVGDRKLYAIAYRNGNGNVTLGASTEVDDVYHWDLTLQNPADRDWFFKLGAGQIDKVQWIRRCFLPLNAKTKTDVITESLADLLGRQPIHPLTMGQSQDHAWWICRMFAQSSSGADHGFAIFQGDEEEIQHPDAWAIAKSYLSKSGARSWNAIKNEGQHPEEVLENESDEAPEQIEENDDDLTDEVVRDIDRARLLQDDAYALTLVAAVDSDDIILEVEVVRAALLAEGTSLSKAANDTSKQTADFKKFRAWCSEHRFLRPFFFKKQVAALKALATSLLPPCAISPETTTASAVYNAIKAHLEQHPETERAANAERADEHPVVLVKRQKLLRAVLSAAFLKKQTGDSREYTRRGLDLEKPFARKLMEDSNNGRTAGFKVHEIATVPVVERTGISHRSAIGSTDFAVSIEAPRTFNRGVELAVVEMKARVKDGTAERERVTQGLAKIRVAANNGLVDRSQRYYQLSADDELFSHFVSSRKEALQILHHAYIYDVAWVLLMIGDNHGRIIAGLWIRFDSSLKNAWGYVLEDMYKLSISFLYEQLERPGFDLPEEDRATVEPVVESIRVAGGDLDMQSFRQMVMVWRVIRLRWPKPLPKASRLLPFIFSSWNAAKGGSDTITKLLWMIKCNPPNKLAQAQAIGRQIQLCFIQIHRCTHIATSKIDLPYKSLLHYRNAGNKRASLHKTLLGISHCFDSGEKQVRTPPRKVTLSPPRAEEEPALVGRLLRGTKPKLRVYAPAVPITGSTPARGVKKQLDALLSKSSGLAKNKQLVADRVRKCTGIPVYGPRGTCIVCKNITNWFCVGCHVSVCMNDVSKAKNAEQFDCHEMDLTIPALPGSGADPKRFDCIANKCYIHHHRAAIFQLIGASRSDEGSGNNGSSNTISP